MGRCDEDREFLAAGINLSKGRLHELGCNNDLSHHILRFKDHICEEAGFVCRHRYTRQYVGVLLKLENEWITMTLIAEFHPRGLCRRREGITIKSTFDGGTTFSTVSVSNTVTCALISSPTWWSFSTALFWSEARKAAGGAVRTRGSYAAEDIEARDPSLEVDFERDTVWLVVNSVGLLSV